MKTIQEYLKENGFERYTNYDFPLNRWERKDPNGWGGRYASFTLNEDGTKTEYGCVFWETADQSHELIQKRKFTGDIKIEDIEKILNIDIQTKELPSIVNVYPINNNQK